MDKSQKKHLKKLKRQHQLEKKLKNSISIPWHLNIRYTNIIEFAKMAGFQKTAYENMCVENIYKELLRENKLKYFDLKDHESRLSLTTLIIEKLYEKGCIITPYFIPTFDMCYSPSAKTVNMVVNSMQPQVFKNKTHGNIYHFGGMFTKQNKEYKVWYTSHAIDQIRERFYLDKSLLSVVFWLNFFQNTKVILEERDKQEFLVSTLMTFKHEKGDYDLKCHMPVTFEDDNCIAITCFVKQSYKLPLPLEQVIQNYKKKQLEIDNIRANNGKDRFERLEAQAKMGETHV